MSRPCSLTLPSWRSVEERNALVVQYQYLPRRVVRVLSNSVAVQRIGYDDAIQVGFLGLLRAAEKWDASRGVKFITYAFHAVRNRILQAGTLCQYRPVCYLPVRACDNGDYGWTEDATLPHPAAPPARYDPLEMQEIMEALDKLPPRWRKVLRLRYLRGKPMRDVAKAIRRSKQRTSELRDMSLAWLRAYLDGDDPPPAKDFCQPKERQRIARQHRARR